MAFSTAQEQYIKTIVASHLKDYPGCYYVAWNTQTSDAQKCDLHILISSDDMYFDNEYLSEYEGGAYFLKTAGKCVQYDIITGNISGYNPDYSNRIMVSELSDNYTIAIPAYNTVSTNCEWDSIGYCLAGDIIQSEGVYYETVQSQVYSYSLGILVLLVLFLSFFTWVFGKR